VSEYIIRKVSIDDLLEINTLILENANHTLKPIYTDVQMQAFLSYYTLDALTNKLNDSHFFCAFDGNEMVGVIGLQDITVVGFYTKVSFLGRGVGKLLLHHIESFALTQGYTTINLASSPISISFYEKQGWLSLKKIYPIYCGISFEEMLMEKKLVVI
jgi:GNAT superfamily N-acetyltransferase